MEELKWKPAGSESAKAIEIDQATQPKTQPKTESANELLKEAIDTLKHAQVFISSREKMHPDGLKLYQECLDNLEKEYHRRTSTFVSVIESMLNK